MNRLSCLLVVLILFFAVSATHASGVKPGDSPANPWSIAPLARNYFSSYTLRIRQLRPSLPDAAESPGVSSQFVVGRRR
jgi:hypothetical protein